ncbi:MAG TPA: hypothetical protein VFB94_24720 [Acidimicrobiales bacterium]|nr:hypothetical protein [Acidimicrobiales bacterium]
MARLDAVALRAVRGRVRVVEVGKVPDACGGVVGAADVATATRGVDRPAPIALGRTSSRPIRLAAQATTVTARLDNGGRRNPKRRARLPAPPPAAT